MCLETCTRKFLLGLYVYFFHNFLLLYFFLTFIKVCLFFYFTPRDIKFRTILVRKKFSWRVWVCITRLVWVCSTSRRRVMQTHTRQKTFHRTRSVMYYYDCIGNTVYAVNGPTSPMIPVRGFIMNPNAETIFGYWGPNSDVRYFYHSFLLMMKKFIINFREFFLRW